LGFILKGVIEMNEKFANIIAEVELFLNSGKIDGAKLGLIMAAQNIGDQLANMLEVLEMMVKVQAKEGLYWSFQAQNYANFILNTVEKDKDLEYSYFEFRVALIHAMALVKKPVSDDEFERSDHLMEIIKLQDEYLNYATEYFESDENFFEAFMASNLLFSWLVAEDATHFNPQGLISYLVWPMVMLVAGLILAKRHFNAMLIFVPAIFEEGDASGRKARIQTDIKAAITV
jgi:hypothetical protein